MYIHKQIQGVKRPNILTEMSVSTANTMSGIQSIVAIDRIEV